MALKPGVETGSFTNYLLSGTVGEPEPKVGDGATIIGWTDRQAATIIKVSRCKVTVQYDKVTRIDKNGMSESQDYLYERDENGQTREFRKTKKGWRAQGGGSHLRLGDRSHYHDYSF